MLKRLQEELKNDDKLKKSSLAQETLNFIEKLTTKSVESIKDILDLTIDQECLKNGLKDETKTLSQLGKFMYWIAKSKQSSNMYAMSHQEAASTIYDYFTKPLPEKFAKEFNAEKESKEKEIKSKEKDKIEKAKDVRRKKLSKLDFNNASITELKEYVGLFKIKGTLVPLEKQNSLVKVSEEDQLRMFIDKYNNKQAKTNKVAKKVVKEKLMVSNQVSLFDKGEL